MRKHSARTLVFSLALAASVAVVGGAQSALAAPASSHGLRAPIGEHARPLGGAKPGTIINEATGMCMTSLGSHTVGAPVEQYACDGQDSQKWSGTLAVQGVQIENQADALCVANTNGVVANNHPMTLQECSYTPWQLDFLVYGANNTKYSGFHPTTSGLDENGDCLSGLGSNANNSPVVEYACDGDGNANQGWGGTFTYSE
jgi:Ricin-type beta-trefoil lectin domain